MCGIYGWIGRPPGDAASLVRTNARLLRHRGPDDEGFESGEGWGFGFRRLSILDLSPTGHQPMSSPDGRYWLVFNGEIYNYVELREELEQRGERFAGTSDTEVLLRLLALRGRQALPALNGMFALAFVDTVERRFLLARDRLGQKPLYYLARPGQLRFASELKGIASWDDSPREIDRTAFVQFLVQGYLTGDSCALDGYDRLPAAGCLEGALDAPEQARGGPYWKVDINPAADGPPLRDDDLDALHDLLRDAVRVRLRSDVDVGVFLSGGIDSGLVAALAAEVASDPVVAFTVGFEERGYDESELATATARACGLEQRHATLPEQSLAGVDRMAWFYDEPFGDSSALPTFALCELAAEHATVFLTGDGGDEAFAGYRRYRESSRLGWLGKVPSALQLVLRSAASTLPRLSRARYRVLRATSADSGFAAVYSSLPDDPALALLLHDDLRPHVRRAGDPIWEPWSRSRGADLVSRMQRLDYATYLPDDILVKVDRASMAQSIELRSPLLDYRIVEWAARLPRAVQYDAGTTKLPLRRLAERLLPDAVRDARKHGFAVPVAAWFRSPAGARFLRERLLSDEALRRGLWRPEGVERIVRHHQAGRGRGFDFVLWNLLMFDAWARLYADGRAFLDGPPGAPAPRP